MAVIGHHTSPLPIQDLEAANLHNIDCIVKPDNEITW